jgi:FeS assembly SUF system protein
MLVTEEQILAALRECYDPEIPVNIVDLGLIYEVTVNEQGAVRVQMTLTSPNCPAGVSILDQVKQRVASVPGAGEVDVNLVWEPAWDPSRISADARKQLGIDGDGATEQ